MKIKIFDPFTKEWMKDVSNTKPLTSLEQLRKAKRLFRETNIGRNLMGYFQEIFEIDRQIESCMRDEEAYFKAMVGHNVRYV